MSDRRLLIDVGNGRTKFGLATSEDILERREHPTRELSPDTVRDLTRGWSFDGAVICSVVPKAVPAFRAVFGETLIELRHDTPMGIGIRYPKPESIGPDRLANAVALAHMHGAPGIVIDFGTAVTFDILSADKFYVGGVIAPGLRLMTDYLHERTALLPRVDLREPASAIGQSTEAAILAGAAIGYRGMVKGILESLKKELSAPNSHIVATGGDAEWIISGMGERIAVDPDLTLHGLRLVGNLAALK
ncbi:type III pantothenate kinase [Prosthecobacter sp.]|uniref:type III pantothenate kinase n=1 Tax=Prosthecobacter sp. TaxID=1965333 RepID=UPI001D6DA045|nr:type III pantothenate kinase [Prosthecobacter sp.]MCB1275459.1 type III pantothenate kinase [Prosthecobacter sp.]